MKLPTWTTKAKETRKQTALGQLPHIPDPLLSHQRAEAEVRRSAAGAISTPAAEQTTVVDQLHTGASSAEDKGEACPRHVGNRAIPAQPRQKSRDVVEVPPEDSAVTMCEEAEPTEEAHESGALRGDRDAGSFTRSTSGPASLC